MPARSNTKGSSGGNFIGRNASSFWEVNSVNVTTTTSKSAGADSTNSVMRGAHFYESVLARAICLGVDNAAPRTFRWTNERFVAEFTGPNPLSDIPVLANGAVRMVKVGDPAQIFGALSSSNGFPVRLQVADFDEAVSPYYINYKVFRNKSSAYGVARSHYNSGRAAPEPGNNLRVGDCLPCVGGSGSDG